MLAELLLVGAITLLGYAFYKWATLNRDYFKQRGLKSMKPNLLFGNTGDLFFSKISAVDFVTKIYSQCPGEPVYGMFDLRKPQFVARDPEVIKQIGVKDFDYFVDHQGFGDVEVDKLFGSSLISLRGEKWRDMRATLSPAFTGSKMRQMFELVSECAEGYVNHFTEEAKSGKKIDAEMKDLFSRYANDVIASCAFGIRTNSAASPDNDFYINGKKLLDFTGVATRIRFLFISLLPKLAKALKIPFFDPKISRTFKSIILDTMDTRKSRNIHRPDMINLLMHVREGSLKQQADEKPIEEADGFATVEESAVGKASVSRTWNDNEIVAQCFLFFLAGFDTSSTLLTFASYELLVNQGIQQKLYEEIAETNERLHGGRLTYDALQKMKYLDQVVCEALRKWPPPVQTDRQCVKDYVFDDGERKFKVEKGRVFLIPIYGLHHDPKHFPDPEKFDPERFSEENKHNIAPNTYLPFGVGPRNCIGSRFALMEVKAILYYLLLNFSFEVNEKTEIPVKLKKSPFNLGTENGMHIQFKPRRK